MASAATAFEKPIELTTGSHKNLGVILPRQPASRTAIQSKSG
jgi:hypothetical protein